MTYQGFTLCTTFAVHKDGHRYCYVSLDTGFPLESIGRNRWKQLEAIQKQEQGWTVIGTWPVGKHPKNVWDSAAFL